MDAFPRNPITTVSGIAVSEPETSESDGDTNDFSAPLAAFPRTSNAMESQVALLSPGVYGPLTAQEAMSLRWRPCAGERGPELVVTQGDLTTARVDAIVNATNSLLSHNGGVASAIMGKRWLEIADDCHAWIQLHGRLLVGKAMSTRAGILPCRHVIHTVGLQGGGCTRLTREQTRRLRDSVRSSLLEADRLELLSIAMPSVSSSHSGYPTELATMEIVGECVRYACEKARTTTLKTIVLMDVDVVKHNSFLDALWAAAELCTSGNMPEEASDLNFHVDTAMVTASPTLPVLPPPLFELVSRNDPEYKRVVAELHDVAYRIVSIRRVRASPRHEEYEKTKLAVQGAHVREIEPLYHGTPNRWRATAIALNGFDLSIKLQGRTYGDGVYAAMNASTASVYSHGKGSLLRLRGLVVSNSTSDNHNTIVSGEIHVFPDPTALLSLMIIDFAAEDDADRMQTQQC